MPPKGDSYRPPGRSNRGSRPEQSASLADRMTFNSGGGSTYGGHKQGNGNQSSGAQFTFTAPPQAPQFPSVDSATFSATNPPTGPKSNRGDQGRKKRRGGKQAADARSSNTAFLPSQSNGNRPRRQNKHRGSFNPRGASNRKILQSQDDNHYKPQEYLGDAAKRSKRFHDVDLDAPSDGSASMEISSSKKELVGSETPRLGPDTSTAGNAIPKWSNPDPYTVLPPPSESTGKKRDFVQLIRKARNEEEEKAAQNNAVAANDDFISFGDDEIEEHRPSRGGALPATKRSGTAAGLPDRPQHSGIPSKRTLDEYERDPVVGGVVQNWLAKPGSPAEAWCKNDTYFHRISEKFPNSDTRMVMLLHNEILDFYDFVQPNGYDEEVRSKLVTRIDDALNNRSVLPGPCRVLCFGSYPARLYLPMADLDLVFVTDRHYNGGGPAVTTQDPIQVRQTLRAAMKRIRSAGLATSITPIFKAKVPIIKFVERKTGIKVDLSFENLSGLPIQQTFKTWQKDYPDMVFLIALVKQFLVMRELSDVHTGGLGGLSVICLVVSFMAQNPELDNLGELLLGFLDFYGNDFDLAKERIVMDPPRYVRKSALGIDGRAEKTDGLSIQDPHNPQNNISGGSSRAKVVFRAFSAAYDALDAKMDREEQKTNGDWTSILEVIIGGDYEAYHRYRHDMYQSSYGF